MIELFFKYLPDITAIFFTLDFLIIDREHGSKLRNNSKFIKCIPWKLQKICRVSAVKELKYKGIRIKPEGILVPQISYFDDAKNAIEYSYYPLIGSKGLSPYTRAFNFSDQEVENKKSYIIKN